MRIEVAPLFAEATRMIGGTALDDVLKGPGFENADYWFPEFNVYAELKCLAEDLISDRQFQDTVRDMSLKWARQGRVKFPRGGYLALDSMPVECQEEFLQKLKRKLEGTVKKANKQVRGTKSEFGHTDASGMLILVNDGNMLLQPPTLLGLLNRCLSNPQQFTSLQSVIVATVNETVSLPDRGGNNWFWLHGYILDRNDGGRSEALARKLQGAIQELHSKLTGLNMSTLDLEPTAALISTMKMHRHERGPVPSSADVSGSRQA